MKRSVIMTEGRPLPILIAFTLPLMLGNIFQQLYSMVDAMVVGRFVSKEALAAIGATSAIQFLMISIIIGFNTGVGVVSAQFSGAQNAEKLRRTFSTATWICIIETLVLSVAGCMLTRPGLELLGTPSDIIEDSVTYLLFNFSTCAAPIFYNMVSNFMRSLGDSKTPLYALIISSLTNIVLDLVFVLVFHMGVAGVALATAIAQALSAVFCYIRIYIHFREVLPKKNEWSPDRNIFKNVLRIGIPMSVQNILVSFGMMSIQGIINGFGTNVVAGYTAANKVDQIALQFMMAIGTAMSTYAGQNYGAKLSGRIFSGIRSALLMSAVSATILTSIILFLGRFIVLLFMEAAETEVISIATGYLSTVSIFYLLCSVTYVYSNTLRGMGLVVIPTGSSFLELGAKILGAGILSSIFGYRGIWFAWPISWLFSSVLLIVYFHVFAAKKLKSLPAEGTSLPPDNL